jgi:hypothetical protein
MCSLSFLIIVFQITYHTYYKNIQILGKLKINNFSDLCYTGSMKLFQILSPKKGTSKEAIDIVKEEGCGGNCTCKPTSSDVSSDQ